MRPEPCARRQAKQRIESAWEYKVLRSPDSLVAVQPHCDVPGSGGQMQWAVFGWRAAQAGGFLIFLASGPEFLLSPRFSPHRTQLWKLQGPAETLTTLKPCCNRS